MTKSIYPAFVVFAVAVTTGIFATATATPGPLSLLHVSATNPRYFADASNNIVYLTGSHAWASLVDQDSVSPPGIFNYSSFLNFMATHNHNFMRMWIMDHPKFNTPTAWYNVPLPYPRTGPGTATDGLPKFDLSQFNQSFFDRLRQRVIDAGNRGIYVSIMFFEAHESISQDVGCHPFQQPNNINGIDANPSTIVYQGSNSTITTMQKTFIRKVVDTVNDLDNVLYEICNETGSGSTSWQYDLIDYVKSYEAGKPVQHPVGMTSQAFGQPDSVLFGSNADWISPVDDTTAATGSKVILIDTDHVFGVGGDAIWVWKTFLRGMNPIYMDPLTTGVGTPDEGARLAMGDTKRYADRMNLATMTPHNALSSSGYILASNTQWITYVPSGSVTVNLSAGAGTFNVEWFNIANRTTTAGGQVAGGAIRSFTSPGSSSNMILYIYRPTPHPLVRCSLLRQRLHLLQRRRHRLQQRHRSTQRLNRRIRQVQRQLQLRDC
jgi:hypothetical protein